ncbi:MAG: DMT family transporter [Bacillota bacterium]
MQAGGERRPIGASHAVWGTVLTGISALGFSTLPIFGMMAYGAGGNVVTLLGYRFLLAAAVLWAYIAWTRHRLPDLRTALGLLLMGGAGYTTMSALYLSSVEGDRLSPAIAALLLYTYPAVVTLLAWRFDSYRMTGSQVAALLGTLAGVALVLVGPGGAVRFTWAGAGLALSAALVYGTYILFGSRVSRRTTPLVTTAFVSTAAAAVLLLYGAVAGELRPMQPAGWMAVLGAALLATVLAVLLFFAGIERLGPSRASIISTLEPVGTAALAAILYGERLGSWQLMGGVIVLASIIWLQSRST